MLHTAIAPSDGFSARVQDDKAQKVSFPNAMDAPAWLIVADAVTENQGQGKVSKGNLK
jgi:hypothetical protein